MALAVRAERREEGLTKASRTWVKSVETWSVIPDVFFTALAGMTGL